VPFFDEKPGLCFYERMTKRHGGIDILTGDDLKR
jgi:hypothetical protein